MPVVTTNLFANRLGPAEWLTHGGGMGPADAMETRRMVALSKK